MTHQIELPYSFYKIKYDGGVRTITVRGEDIQKPILKYSISLRVHVDDKELNIKTHYNPSDGLSILLNGRTVYGVYSEYAKDVMLLLPNHINDNANFRRGYELSLETDTKEINVENIDCESINVETATGKVYLTNAVARLINIETGTGYVNGKFPLYMGDFNSKIHSMTGRVTLNGLKNMQSIPTKNELNINSGTGDIKLIFK